VLRGYRNEFKTGNQGSPTQALFIKIHQLRSAYPKNPPTAMCLIRKRTNYSVNTSQLMDFLEKALRSWWIFRKSTSQLVDF